MGKASEEGQGPSGAVEPMTMMMMMSEWLSHVLFTTATTVIRLRVLCEVRAETEETVKE